jgi:hypothetical protein
MASHHTNWQSGSTELERSLTHSLKSPGGSRGVLEKWRRHSRQLIGPDAHRQLALYCLNSKKSVTAQLSEWGLTADSQFGMAAAGELALRATEPVHASRDFAQVVGTYLAEDNPFISPADWGRAFERLVTNTVIASDPSARQELVDLALKTRGLDDPRLRRGQWENVPARARDIVIQWLSEEDLRFFFDLLMQDRADHQKRRRFWLRYLDGAIQSRVVVGKRDYNRLRAKLSEIEKRGRTYARMRGAGANNDHVSAFIMDFGKVTIVEFSQANSACYIYVNDPRAPYLNLAQQVFHWDDLKNRQMGEHHAHVHPPSRWHEKFKRVLAQYGVRPE